MTGKAVSCFGGGLQAAIRAWRGISGPCRKGQATAPLRSPRRSPLGGTGLSGPEIAKNSRRTWSAIRVFPVPGGPLEHHEPPFAEENIHIRARNAGK